MTHALKTWIPFYKAQEDGLKLFELRKDDRPYSVGDKFISQEYDKRKGREPNLWEFYWLDFGNLKETGQVVLGSAGHVMQPNQPAVIHKLKNVVQYFPQLKKIREKNQGPSCSLAEALNKQDLFINSTLANHGMSLLWTMFTKGRILNQGVYLNLSSSQVNPLPFK